MHMYVYIYIERERGRERYRKSYSEICCPECRMRAPRGRGARRGTWRPFCEKGLCLQLSTFLSEMSWISLSQNGCGIDYWPILIDLAGFDETAADRIAAYHDTTTRNVILLSFTYHILPYHTGVCEINTRHTCGQCRIPAIPPNVNVHGHEQGECNRSVKWALMFVSCCGISWRQLWN